MLKKTLQIIVALLFNAIFTFIIFWDPLIEKFGSIQWDAIGVHFFNLLFSSQAWHTGTFPLWTPYIFNGFPQVADLQVAIFYPVNLIISYFSVFTAEIMQYQLIFHYFLAGFFAFLLTRNISKNFFFSLGAGAVYAFSGFMVGHGSHVGMQNTSAWLPLLILLLMRALDSDASPFHKRIRDGFLCGLFLGIAILAGHFQMALYLAYSLGFYFAFDFVWSLATKLNGWLKERKETQKQAQAFSSRQFIIASKEKIGKYELLQKIFIISSIYVIAFLISAIQLLPTYELTAKSQRAEISLEMSQTESLNPDSLRGLITPNHQNVSHGGDYTGPWDRTQNYLFITITILILAALGAILGAIKKETRKITVFFILLGSSSLIYSLGKYGFLQQYYYQFVPFFNKIRAPSNMILLFNLAIIGLAAIAIRQDVFLGNIHRRICLVFSDKIFAKQSENKFAEDERAKSQERSERLPKKISCLVASSIIIYLPILTIISIELFYAVSPNELLYARKSASEITKKPWIAENIQSEYSALDEINKFRTFKVPEFQDNSTQMWQIYAFDGYNPLALQRYGAFVDTMVKNANFVDLAGIKYLPCQFIPERAANLEKVGNLCINENYYPRAFFVDHFIVAENDQDALSKLNTIGSPREVVILEEDPKVFINQNSRNQSISITDAKSEFWKLSTQNESDSFLVFSQTNYPGWITNIDGQNTKIFQADYLFQAIFVPKGQHEIIFEFKSPSLKNGFILTIIGLVIVLLGSLSAYIFNRIYKNTQEKE